MSDRKRQRYTDAFKAEAVRLWVEGDRSAAAVARDLGVRADLLRKWKQEQRAAGLVQEPRASSRKRSASGSWSASWRWCARSGTF